MPTPIAYAGYLDPALVTAEGYQAAEEARRASLTAGAYTNGPQGLATSTTATNNAPSKSKMLRMGLKNTLGGEGGAFGKGGAGWSAMGNVASGVDSVISTGHGFDDQGEWGQAANGIFDKASDTLMKIPGAQMYGAALKAADFVGDLSAKMGLTNDGQTGIDQISQNGVGNLVVGTLLGNNLFTRKTSKFGADEETLENVGGSYGGTTNDIYAAADKADKRYGWMSSHNRKKAQRAIDTARAQQNQLAAISKQNEQMHQMVDMMGGVAADAYRTQLMGGYDQSAMRVGRGGRLEGKDHAEEGCAGMMPMVEEIADPTEAPVVVEIVLEQYDPRVPCREVGDIIGGGTPAGPGCPLDGPGQECPTDQIREKVVRDFTPEIVDLVNDVASDTMDGVMQKVRESAARQMGMQQGGTRQAAGGVRSLGSDQVRPETADKADMVMREVADVRDEVLEDYVPEIIEQIIPEVYGDFGQVAEAVGGEGLKERVVEEFVPEIVDRVVPEVWERSGEAAGRGAFEMKRRLVGRMTGRDIADLFDTEMPDGYDEEADGPSCVIGSLPPDVARFIGWIDGGGPERLMRGGSSSGFSYSTGSSSSSVTRDMPGVGPVTVTRRSVMRPQVNVWAKGGKAVERQLDAPEIEESLQKNLIPEGALHRQRHHMDMGDDVTKKGIPVMDIKEDSGQEAEIERNEIIFNKEVTEKLEELYAVYYDEQSTEEERDQAAIDAGKLLTREIMLNTDDRTGLIDTLRRGGKVQDGGKVKYKGRSLDDLVAYAKEKSPRFIQRMDEFPMIVDVGDGRYGSHLLAYATDSEENPTKAWIYPEVMEVEDGDGLRVYTGEEAVREAQRRGDWLEVTPDEAEYFTGHYKEAWPDYMNAFDEMEKYMRAHPNADPVMVRKMFMARSDGKGGRKRGK